MKKFLYRFYKRVFKTETLFKENRQLIKFAESYDNAVIFGSGPSINQIDCSVCANDFVITMGNFYEHPDINSINPKIHIFAASHSPITDKVLTDWWTRCHEILPKTTKLLIEARDKRLAEKIFIDREVFYYSYGGNLPVDFTKKIMSPWSVTIVAVQLAIYCNIKNIGLLGIDHDWQNLTEYSHFYSHDAPSLEYYLIKNKVDFKYPESMKRLPKEKLYKEYELYQQYEKLKKEAEGKFLKIKNIDPFSHFDVFEFDKRNDLIKTMVND